jgi:hypothetical protein
MKRRFLISTKKGGIAVVTTCSEQEYLGLESLVELMSRTLPHRGGIPPLLSHKLPVVPKNEVSPIF